MSALRAATQIKKSSLFVLSLREAPAEHGGDRVARFDVGDLAVEVRAIGDSLWAIVRREGRGGSSPDRVPC